jgi:sugar/nucleoside kinase (ribokinase family)
MTSAKYDVLGIGNAIFDILVQTDEGFLAAHGMTKGGMALIDENSAASIYRDMGPATEMSGGSAANTIVGLANLGARAAYVGKVKDDQIGRLYTHDIRAAGVAFETRPAADGPATGCSYILVTPDGERTMNTYLGAAQELTSGDIDAAQVAAAAILYLEGYLWDPKSAKEAFVKASTIAHDAGRQVALTLSDSFCVDRYRDEFLDLMRKGTVDLIFANEAELHSLYQTGFRYRADAVAQRCETGSHPQREGLRGGVERRRVGGAGVSDRPHGGHHGRRRPVRRRLPVRPGARRRLRKCRPAGRARRRRNHPAHRRAAAGLAEGIGAAERLACRGG